MVGNSPVANSPHGLFAASGGRFASGPFTGGPFTGGPFTGGPFAGGPFAAHLLEEGMNKTAFNHDFCSILQGSVHNTGIS